MRNFYHIKEFYYDEFIELLKKNSFTIEYQFGQTLIGNYLLILISRYFFPSIFGKLMVLSGYRFPRQAVTVVVKARKA